MQEHTKKRTGHEIWDFSPQVPQEAIKRLEVIEAPSSPDRLHLRAARVPGEQVQDDQVLVGLRAAQPGLVTQPHRDPGQDLVSKQVILAEKPPFYF